MTFFERTEQEIISKALEQLNQNTNIKQLTPGGKARAILDVVSREQGIQHSIFDENLMQPFIRYADDNFLDIIGDMLNLPRLGSSFSSSLEADNFIFYVESGTFGDINGGASISVPSGTVVSTVPLESFLVTPGLQEQPVIEYKTTQAVTCSSSESIAYVPIKASIEGSSSRVVRNVLNKHNFTGYIDSSNNSLKCTNQYSIANGEDRETATAYRYRLSNIDKARQNGIPISIRLAALSTRGVANIKEVMCEQGCGSYSIYIRSTTPTPSPALLQEVTNAVYRVSSYGVRPFILAPEPIGIEFYCAVNWDSKATRDDISIGYQNMRVKLESYLNKTEIGESILYSDISDLLLSSSKYAKSIGYNSPNKFEEIFLYRRDLITGGVTKNLTLGDQLIPLYNERPILETSTKNRGIFFITRQ